MIAALALALQAAAAEPPRFPVVVERVYVDAFVTRAGAPVSGLRAADFALHDNGVPQQVTLLEQREAPLGAVLALDTSSSVEGARLQGLREAARAFVAGLGPEDEAALVSFSHSIELATRTHDPAAFARALDAMSAGGGTSLYDAIYAAVRLPLRAPRRLVLVFTDGDDTTSWLEPEDLRAAVTAAGLLVYVVTADDAAPRRVRSPEWFRESESALFLRRLTDATGGRVLSAPTPGDLRKAFVRVLDDLRVGYVLSYEPAGVPQEGEHRIEVRVRGSGMTVRARTGYSAGPLRRREP